MISEDLIMRHLEMLLSGSDPGDAMGALHVVSAAAGAVGPLGVPDEGKLHTAVYAIAADSETESVLRGGAAGAAGGVAGGGAGRAGRDDA